MRTADHAEVFRSFDPDELHELPDVAAVRAACALVVDVREPLRFRRHLREPMELTAREQALGVTGDGCSNGWKRGTHARRL